MLMGENHAINDTLPRERITGAYSPMQMQMQRTESSFYIFLPKRSPAKLWNHT
jgi:hypothetical protein